MSRTPCGTHDTEALNLLTAIQEYITLSIRHAIEDARFFRNKTLVNRLAKTKSMAHSSLLSELMILTNRVAKAEDQAAAALLRQQPSGDGQIPTAAASASLTNPNRRVLGDPRRGTQIPALDSGPMHNTQNEGPRFMTTGYFHPVVGTPAHPFVLDNNGTVGPSEKDHKCSHGQTNEVSSHPAPAVSDMAPPTSTHNSGYTPSHSPHNSGYDHSTSHNHSQNSAFDSGPSSSCDSSFSSCDSGSSSCDSGSSY